MGILELGSGMETLGGIASASSTVPGTHLGSISNCWLLAGWWLVEWPRFSSSLTSSEKDSSRQPVGCVCRASGTPLHQRLCPTVLALSVSDLSSPLDSSLSEDSLCCVSQAWIMELRLDQCPQTWSRRTGRRSWMGSERERREDVCKTQRPLRATNQTVYCYIIIGTCSCGPNSNLSQE